MKMKKPISKKLKSGLIITGLATVPLLLGYGVFREIYDYATADKVAYAESVLYGACTDRVLYGYYGDNNRKVGKIREHYTCFLRAAWPVVKEHSPKDKEFANLQELLEKSEID